MPHTSGAYLLARQGWFYFRCRVPEQVARRIRRREVVRALGTQQPRVARFLTAAIATRIHNLWERLRVAELGEELEGLIGQWFKAELDRAWRQFETGDFARALVPATADKDGLGAGDDLLRQVNREMLEADSELQIERIGTAYRNNDYALAKPAARQIVAGLAAPFDEGDRRFTVLLKAVMGALGQLEEGRLHWAQGEEEFTPAWRSDKPSGAVATLAVQSKAVDGPHEGAPNSFTLAEAIENFVRLKRGEGRNGQGRTEKQVGQLRSHLAILTDALGPDVTTSQVTDSDAGRVTEALQFLPVRFRMVRELVGLPFGDMVEKAKSLKGARLHPRTINSYLKSMRGLFESEKRASRIKSNPFDGKNVPHPRRRRTRRGFTREECSKLFTLPLFAGCKSANRPFDAGDYLLDDWHFWAPMIAFFTGARLAEIAQLRPADIHMAAGIWVIDINENDDKRVKTESSIRKVPVHAELERIGFIRLADLRRDSGRINLLPGVPKPVRGDPGHGLSKWFSGEFLPKAGLKLSPGLGFHSFRHTMKTMLRNAGIGDEDQNKLLGHDDQSVGAGYGDFELPSLSIKLHKVSIPEEIARIPSRSRGS